MDRPSCTALAIYLADLTTGAGLIPGKRAREKQADKLLGDLRYVFAQLSNSCNYDYIFAGKPNSTDSGMVMMASDHCKGLVGPQHLDIKRHFEAGVRESRARNRQAPEEQAEFGKLADKLQIKLLTVRISNCWYLEITLL